LFALNALINDTTSFMFCQPFSSENFQKFFSAVPAGF